MEGGEKHLVLGWSAARPQQQCAQKDAHFYCSWIYGFYLRTPNVPYNFAAKELE